MLFNSYAFLFCFLPLAVAGYWLVLRRFGPAGSIPLLGLASYAFYLVGEHTWPWLLLASIVFNYLIGARIFAAEGRARTSWLVLGVGGDLAALAYFKYSTFLALQFDPATTWRVVLPLGISFYTFTQIAYLADVHQRKTAERAFLPYFLFVTYFPHLIAGPILHHKEMIGQFKKPRTGRIGVRLFAGLVMFAFGLAKKTMVADPCGYVASNVFGAANAGAGFFVGWIGIIAYALQIYFDFSAYSDMALGISAMLGIKLPINFNSPYKSHSLVEFWRRWHISLSRFLRDYLYIGLGGNRKGKARRYVNLITTMVLGGIWHGAGWMFLVWGTLHGVGLALVHGWKDCRLPSPPKLLGWFLTMIFVCYAWAAFRAPDVTTMVSMWKAMSGLDGFALPGFGPLARLGAFLGVGARSVLFSWWDVVVVFAAGAVAVWAPNSQQIMRRFNIGLDTHGYNALARDVKTFTVSLSWRWVLVAGALLGISARAIVGYSEFIYFNF